jgi:hypothetical protein
MVSPAVVKQRVLAICTASDLATLTERHIREQLVAEGTLSLLEVAAAKQVISAAVHEFLMQTATQPQQQPQGADDDDADFVPDDGDAEDEEEGNSEEEELRTRPAKKSRTEAAGEPRVKPGGALVVPLGPGGKHVTIKAFKGRVMVDLRLFWMVRWRVAT